MLRFYPIMSRWPTPPQGLRGPLGVQRREEQTGRVPEGKAMRKNLLRALWALPGEELMRAKAYVAARNPEELDGSQVAKTKQVPAGLQDRKSAVLQHTWLPLHRFKKIIPIPEQSMVQTLCHLLECLLTEEDIPADCPKETYELYFVFAAIWAFGGAMVQDQVRDRAVVDTHV